MEEQHTGLLQQGLRMKMSQMTNKFCLWFFAFLLFSMPVFAQDQVTTTADDASIPVGMESVQVSGGYRLLIPQGAKIRRVGAQIIVEDDREYLSRRFYEISQDVENLRSQVKQLQDDMSMLKEKIKTLEQSNLQQRTDASAIIP